MEYRAFFTAIVFSIFLAACGQGAFQAVPTKIADFRGQLVEGGISSYQIEKGKATLIVLTASWCPGCRQELPHLKNLDQEFSGKGFKILLISEDDTPQVAARYNKAKGIRWTTFHWNYEMMNALGNPGVIPVSYLVNEKDSIVKVDVGMFNESKMKAEIKKLVGSP